MLSLQSIDAGYGTLQILKKVDIEVNENEIVALIGPNGAGKSTVIKSVFNIADVSNGKITFKGKDITNLPTHELIQVGISYVNQGKILFDSLTVKENLEIGALKGTDKEVVQKNIQAVLKTFPEIKKCMNQKAYTLSGGQQQMVALGRGLMANPSLILLDEPSLGLSPKLQKELFGHIKRLKADGISVLLVEQNAKQAIAIADRTYLLEDGKVAFTGGKDIIDHPKIKEVYLGG